MLVFTCPVLAPSTAWMAGPSSGCVVQNGTAKLAGGKGGGAQNPPRKAREGSTAKSKHNGAEAARVARVDKRKWLGGKKGLRNLGWSAHGRHRTPTGHWYGTARNNVQAQQQRGRHLCTKPL